ncbi:MAG: ParB/RepB/Spo0J family partition protein [Gammaproteobacteria bacterium]|nr:ParB/RepB/Spo0J family partition protein [Gammaproteobacteria bacterium]MDH5275628.1 ParB/RepB/Spo0J family partition protein [Gammaproteobacteria bacterium]
MVVKKAGLGRGLEALLGPSAAASTDAGAGKHQPAGDGLQTLAVDLLVRGAYQPRHDMHPETLEDLAQSIRAQGVIQPIVVRPLLERDPSGARRYEIVAGERRWRAAQMAGLQFVPAVVREIPDSSAIAMSLIENIQREDLNPLEEALAIRRLIDEFGLTHEDAADAIGRSRAAVSNLLRLMQLGEVAQELLQKRAIEMGHARALLGLTDLKMQAEVSRLVATKGLSVRETERLIRRMLEGPAKSRTDGASRSTDPDVRRLENDLADKLGAQVSIHHGRGGKGKLVVAYNSIDELEGILGHIT